MGNYMTSKRTTVEDVKTANERRALYGSPAREQYNEELLDELLARVEVLEAQQAGRNPKQEPKFSQSVSEALANET
jgi:hypothetical protein